MLAALFLFSRKVLYSERISDAGERILKRLEASRMRSVDSRECPRGARISNTDLRVLRRSGMS